MGIEQILNYLLQPTQTAQPNAPSADTFGNLVKTQYAQTPSAPQPPPEDFDRKEGEDFDAWVKRGGPQGHIQKEWPDGGGSDFGLEHFENQHGRQPDLTNKKDFDLYKDTILAEKHRDHKLFDHKIPEDFTLTDKERETYQGEIPHAFAMQMYLNDPSRGNAKRLFELLKPKPYVGF